MSDSPLMTNLVNANVDPTSTANITPAQSLLVSDLANTQERARPTSRKTMSTAIGTLHSIRLAFLDHTREIEAATSVHAERTRSAVANLRERIDQLVSQFMFEQDPDVFEVDDWPSVTVESAEE